MREESRPVKEERKALLTLPTKLIAWKPDDLQSQRFVLLVEGFEVGVLAGELGGKERRNAQLVDQQRWSVFKLR